MSLTFASLNSGSNGNCYYAGNASEGVLIDAGICCRQVEERLRRLNLSIHLVKGVLISHEHVDHIKGLEALALKYQLPVFITPSTLKYSRINLPAHLVKYFKIGDEVIIGALKVITFPKYHDAVDPCSFVIEYNHVRFGIFTDIGKPCSSLVDYFRTCHGALLEANYDEAMLEAGNYPLFLKKRISGGSGHLSNHQALNVFTTHKPTFMSHLFLAHLSHNNNCPVVVEKLFKANAQGVNITVASRFKESSVVSINRIEEPLVVDISRRKKMFSQQLQIVFE
jgi:phosphoribosyl 1,2-cyclic phosphodiesterase